MVAPIKPKKVQAFGKESYWLVPAVADVNAPTILEINATTGINVSCTLLSTFTGLSGETAKVTLPSYLCETAQYEGIDRVTYTVSDIEGGFDPQADEASNDKKAFEFLRDGYVGFLVGRPGVKSDSATPEATAGQYFNVIPVDVAEAVPTKSGDGAEAIFTFRAGVAVTGPIGKVVAAVAGA